MQINASSIKGLPEIQAAMKEFSERRLAAALATALTRTAVDVKKVLAGVLPQVFDRPTPYTMNSLYTKPATAAKVMASVYFKDDRATSKAGTPATNYLLPHVDGAKRRTKRFEVALQAIGALPAGWVTVPGAGAKLDAYGNVSTGQIIQVLSQLRITMLSGTNRNMSFDARKQINAQRKAGGRFYVVKPGERGGVPGVYQRELFGRNVTPVLIFVQSVAYKKRFDFWGIAHDAAAQRLPAHAIQAAREQFARLATKRAGGAA